MAEQMLSDLQEQDEDECLTCSERNAHIAQGTLPDPDPYPLHECPKSKRKCGHHCNCSWIHECCHWCGGGYAEDGETWLTAEELAKED